MGFVFFFKFFPTGFFFRRFFVFIVFPISLNISFFCFSIFAGFFGVEGCFKGIFCFFQEFFFTSFFFFECFSFSSKASFCSLYEFRFLIFFRMVCVFYSKGFFFKWFSPNKMVLKVL